MIRVRQKGMLALTTAWLATMIVAFQLGGGRRSAGAASGERGEDVGGSGSAAGTPLWRGYEFNETRRIGNQNRFLTYTQTLGGDELARILPEITDKMTLEQVQTTRKRLFEEVPPGPTRRIARFEVIRRWAQLDPALALEHIASLDDPKMRHDLRLKGVEGWASIAPAAALEFALETEDELVGKSKEAVRAGFATMRDLDSAFRFLPTLASEESPDKGWTVAMAVEALYHNDDLAVIDWVQRLDPGPVREQAMTGVVSQWARHDPDAAARWIEEHAAPDSLDENRKLIQGLAAKAQ